MENKTTLMKYIREEILHGRSNQLSEDEDLLSSGVLSSLGILQLVAFIEERMGIQIPDEDVVYENFYSVSALSNYLNSRQ